MRRRKESLIVGIIIVIILLGLGYAYLTTTLSINGTTNVDSNTWNVYWDNVQVTSGSVTGDQVITAPTIDTNKTTVSFHIRLKEPGEFYEFTVDAKNDGTIDAMIDTITKTTNIPNYINYIITYSDAEEIAENQLLNANSLETYKVRVEYRTDINANDLPSASTSLSLTFGVTYIQANSLSVPIRNEIYSISETTFTIGSNVPTGVTTYASYQEAVIALGHPFFIKHKINNNRVVTESYVGFILNNNVYYIRGAGATYNETNNSWNDDSPYYEETKVTLHTAFGSENCSESIYEGHKEYHCHSSSPYLVAFAYARGLATINDGEYGCSIDFRGNSLCS